jgi:beta-mannosidase
VATGPTASGVGVASLGGVWQVAPADADQPLSPEALDRLDWIPAVVPGTAAGALRDAGRTIGPMDATDWWFRTIFDADAAGSGEEVLLRFDGLATIATVHLNDRIILESRSMFEGHTVDVGPWLRGRNELAIRFHALDPLLAASRRPRARWRTRLVADNNLRWFRTTLHGRIPGFSNGPAVVGPWRQIRLERRRGLAIDDLSTRTRIDGSDGILEVRMAYRRLDDAPVGRVEVSADGPTGRYVGDLRTTQPADIRGVASGELRIPDVARWWPHTHGAPSRYMVSLTAATAAGTTTIDAGRVGFRTLAPGATPDHEVDRDGLFLHVNGVPVFARGALWTPGDAVTLSATPERLRTDLELVRDAGMNIVRLPGFGMYEQPVFHDLCDELGILVWQDLMFASMDYPFDDPDFARVVAREVTDVARRLADRPSTAVICGGSEVLQQIAMLGLDLDLLRLPFYHEVAPRLIEEAGSNAIYVPGAPSGDMPLRPDRGVSNYYAVGGYRAPLSDARTSGVRFASECLAFANVPDEDVLAALVPEPPGDPFVHHPRWKAGVPRDTGSGWDFDDLRDDYLAMLYGVEPRTLRRGGHDRYVELSRAVSGEVMAAVYGEWRRTASPSGGGMILWLRDLVPGAGWGVLDHRGRPKVAYHHLRRILAPIATWIVDEGIGGLIAHVANDSARPLEARLRVALYTDHELAVGGATVPVRLAAHGSSAFDLEVVLDRFVDIAWAYRFGPAAQDVVVVSLERDAPDGPETLSQSFHFPAGRPLAQEPEARLGLGATAHRGADGHVRLEITSRRLAYGVRIHAPDHAASDNAFSVEPGGRRVVTLERIAGTGAFPGASLTALNLLGHVAVRPGDAEGVGLNLG